MILIDGAKAYANVLGVMLGNHLLYGTKEPRLEIDRMILRAITNVEPVDAVKVVRCKECKHWACDDNESYCDELGIFDTDMNSYCSYGKRKDNG